MNLTQRNITNYLRNSVTSQQTQQIKITDDSIKIQFSMLKAGRIYPEICQHLFKKRNKRTSSINEELDADIEEETEEQNLRVIIAVQVVNVNAEGGVKYESNIDDLTGTFFLPASLSEDGILIPEADNIPWIPRNYLTPVVDDVLIVGNVQNVDSFITSKTKELSDIKSAGRWKDYISFAEGFWKAANDTELFGEFIYNYAHGKQSLILDSFAYIIPDDTIYATHNVKKLYEYALTEDQPCNELYQKIISMSCQPDRTLINNSLSQMKKHKGQMNGNYPLSPSQREAMNHFTEVNNGDILAVNGPPGTGKTTLLQSVVADMMIKRALNKKDAPIIVATSTNNQAVTNIIESFAATSKGEHPKKLDTHWIYKKKSFATYFPSKSKVKNALEKGYQVTDTGMGYTVSQLEKEKNIRNSLDNIIECCRNLFNKDIQTLKQCIERLHEMLSDFDLRRQEMLALAETIPFEIQILSNDSRQNIRNMENEILSCRRKESEYKKRLENWEKLWHKLLIYRMLKFIPYMKNRLGLKMSNFRILDEGDLPDNFLTLDDVEKYYNVKLKDNRVIHEGYENARKLLEIAVPFENVDINVFFSKKETVSLSINSLNTLFDTNIRFYEFWLSVHYYECCWLAGEHKVDEKELFKTTYPVMTDKYKRLCMLTPCLVMTFYMLPANFRLYNERYLYNFIDLLIVDEAGQVSPEIGAVSFLLANKALVVGDIYQIEPVWGVSRELDIALAIDQNVIPPDSFHLLEESGLNTSESNLMKIASNSCYYSKFGKKGLLLTEHRRCYDELIKYCNELVYDGKLDPLRGTSTSDPFYPFVGQSALKHIQVSTTKSERRKTSRRNVVEAQKIREWLIENLDDIKKAYHNEPFSSLIGIITPFKAQADYIRDVLQDYGQNIAVGTVHTFQGGERKIILFSTVYGADDGCAFLDFKPNLMNVAMSRAKDRFIVFGDINCLSCSKQKPSGLLRTYF